VTVLEAEESTGYHSSGRSATMLHYALGNPLVRALTFASRAFVDQPPDGFSPVPLGATKPVLIHAREDELPALDELDALIAPFAELQRVGEAGIRELCPVLRVSKGGAVAALIDRDAIKLDSDALLQGYARMLRSNSGHIVTGARASQIARSGSAWQIYTERGDKFSAPILINAAGSWADQVAALAGIAQVGLSPKRRTIITFDGPDGADVSNWPFVKTVGEELYFAPESGRLFASPMDEIDTDPCDAQPDDYEVALAAHRVEERTTMEVKRIVHKWAGLRTFAPDRKPVAGFAADAEGFFWLAGQGGFGLQTSPAMAMITESLICGTPWPLDDVAAEDVSPLRF
jgi:D-arginine dehydrogenase